MAGFRPDCWGTEYEGGTPECTACPHRRSCYDEMVRRSSQGYSTPNPTSRRKSTTSSSVTSPVRGSMGPSTNRPIQPSEGETQTTRLAKNISLAMGEAVTVELCRFMREVEW